MIDWRSTRVLVTGGAGFVGRHLVARLRAAGADVAAPRRAEFDLVDRAAARRLFETARPDVVFHLAAVVGGIGANQREPGRFFLENLLMGAHVLDECRRVGVRKLVFVGTICAYPKVIPVPFREEDLWAGYPEETNAPYGIAKKAFLVGCQAYRAQYGLNAIYLLPVNLYGPGDNFEPETSHVIPALIRKMVEAKEAGARRVTAWGTGNATREFLYVDDCAEALVLAAERYDGPEPVNLGSGEEISIRNLADRIARAVGYDGAIEWDSSKPDGQPRRALDTSRAARLFGWRASTPFDEGLRRTVAWYLEGR